MAAPHTPSAQARLTLQDAFDRFARSVSQDDYRTFQNTELQDVRDEALKIERQLRARRTQRNMARLEPFLLGLEHYSKVIEVLCNGTPYLSWIWAPVKLMLSITMDSLSAFEKLIEAYGKIADLLPRLDRLSAALGTDINFQNVLALVYSDILEFHRRAYKFVRRKSWAIFFGSMWAGFETRFHSILVSLTYHTALLDKEAAAIDISEAVRRSKEDGERWELQEREWQATKLRAVLAWLKTDMSNPEEIYYRHCQGSVPDSCAWFMLQDKMKLWQKDGADHTLVRLTGKPGAGKSFICSNVVRHLETNGLNVLYYYCSYLTRTADSCTTLLQSLVSQLIQKHQDLALFVYNDFFAVHPKATQKALVELLPKLLQAIGSTRLVIDGLDEWDAHQQKELLDCLPGILSNDRASHICKVLISSRDTLEISRNLVKKCKASPVISLSGADERVAVNKSIACFVDARLAEVPSHIDDMDPKRVTLNVVKQKLLRKSNGMFLWVRLVLDAFEFIYTLDELNDIVDSLPSHLESLYQQILDRICKVGSLQKRGGVPRILGLICFAQRPLHKQEILHALAIPSIDSVSQSLNVPAAEILDHCKPLVEERSDGTLSVVHITLKEYFLTVRFGQKCLPPQQVQLDLAMISVVTLSKGLELVRPNITFSEVLFQTASCNYRLLFYALEYWVEHCFQYASSSPRLHSTFTRHLDYLHEKHSRLAQLLGIPSPANESLDELDERLRLFSQTPAQFLMREQLVNSQLTSKLKQPCRDGKEAESFTAQNDKTLFSRIAITLDSAVEHLLLHDQVEGVPQDLHESFRVSHVSTAYRCRYPHCPKASAGFASESARSQHEKCHFHRLYCNYEGCSYSRIGFDKHSSLVSHKQRYHTAKASLMTPPRIRSGGSSSSEDRKLAAPENISSTTLQVPQQQDMQQLLPRSSVQGEGQFINQLAKKLMDTGKPEYRTKFQSEVNAWPDQMKQQLIQKGFDPLFFRFREHAEMLYRSGRVQMPKQQDANPMEGQQPLNMQDPIRQSTDTNAPYGGFTERSFDLPDYRAFENPFMIEYIPPSGLSQQSGIRGLPGQLPPASSYADADRSYVTPTMWQEVVASSFQPGVKRGWSEIPFDSDEDYGKVSLDELYSDSLSLDITGDVSAGVAHES